MARNWSNVGLGLLSLLLGGLIALGASFSAGYLLLHPGGDIISFLLWTMFLTPLGAGFLLTVLIPRAADWGSPAGHMLCWGIVAYHYRWVTDGPVAIAALTIGVCAAFVCWLGVLAARHLGPARCHRPKYTPPGEPRCPKCGYVLYFVANRRCPECGRCFTLHEVDARQAEWDGQVLRPKPAAEGNAESASRS